MNVIDALRPRISANKYDTAGSCTAEQIDCLLMSV